MTEVAYKQYLFEYRHDGSEWGIEITASSAEDAEARIKSLAWAKYRGEVRAKIPVPGTTAFSQLRNLISHLQRIVACWG